MPSGSCRTTRHSCVRLEVGKSIDDVNAVRLELLRPDDVVALVETRLQFHQHRHLFASFGGLDRRSMSGESGPIR